MILKQNTLKSCYAVHVFKLRNTIFTLDGSNKIHPTNVRGRASTKVPWLALTQFDCDRSLLLFVSDTNLKLTFPQFRVLRAILDIIQCVENNGHVSIDICSLVDSLFLRI